jgi:hypothetical protein
VTLANTDEYPSLAHLALKKAALVEALATALDEVLMQVREGCLERHLAQFGDTEGWAATHSGIHKRPTLVQLTLTSRAADSDKKRRRVLVDVMWRAGEEGGEIVFKTRAASDGPNGLRWPDLRTRAAAQLAGDNATVPGGRMATSRDSVLWQSSVPLTAPDDLDSVLGALDEHLALLPLAGQAYRDEAATRLT